MGEVPKSQTARKVIRPKGSGRGRWASSEDSFRAVSFVRGKIGTKTKNTQ